MKISFDYDSLTINNEIIDWTFGPDSPVETHWVAELDSGSFEEASSGSPAFDQNKRVIGQLHGGTIQCPPTDAYYGRLDSSWTGGGTDISRLSNWLDPSNTGTQITNTLRSPVINGNGLVCTSETYTVGNIPPNFEISNWDCLPSGHYSFYTYSDSCAIINDDEAGTITLTATLVDTLTYNDTIQISREIYITYAPNYYTLYATLTTGEGTDWLQDYNCLLTYTFPGMYSGEINILDPAGYPIIENATWTKLSQQNCSFADVAPSSNGKYVFLNFKPYGCRAVVRMTAYNDCGSFYYDYTFRAGDSPYCSFEIEKIITTPIITIYPNPTNGTITIDYKAEGQESWIEDVIVTNSLGTVILKKKYYSQNTITLNLSDQISGVYFLELFNGTEWTCHQISIKR